MVWMHGIRAVALAVVFLGGCSTHYRPMAVDAKLGRYETSTEVDPGAVLTYDSKVRPGGFPVVLIITDSNLYPPRFEFAVRQALAQLGASSVFNVSEFRELASDRNFPMASPADAYSSETVAQFSKKIAPVLVVSASYRYVAEARVIVSLRVVDGRSDRRLLDVQHNKAVWSDFAGEALFPVFNQLRRWYQESAGGGSV